MKHLVLLLTLVISTVAGAENVFKVGVKSVSGNRLIVRFTAEPGPYNANEGICIYRNRKTVACGSVISADANTLEIRILRGVTQFTADERLLVRGNEKFNLADGKGADASAAGAKGAKPPIKNNLNISSGVLVFAPATFFLIPLTIDYAIGTKTIIGIEPFYATSGPALTVIGANLHFHYYFKEKYRRLYFFGGLGYFMVTGKATDTIGTEVTENIGSIAIRFGLGNRWVFGKNFNMSLQGGGMYLSKTEGAQLNFGFNQISGLVGLQFGWLF